MSIGIDIGLTIRNTGVGSIFVSGLESETDAFTIDFTGKSVAGSNTATVTTAAGEFNNGAKGGKLAYAGSSPVDYVYKTLIDQTTIYVRMYFKLKTGFAMAGNFDSVHILAVYDSGSSRQLMGVRIMCDADHSNFKLPVYANNEGTTVYAGTAGEITLNTWHYVEVKWIKGGAGSGQAEVWLNGVSKGSVTTGTWNSYDADQVRIGGFDTGYHNPVTGSEMYFDDVKIQTSRVGA